MWRIRHSRPPCVFTRGSSRSFTADTYAAAAAAATAAYVFAVPLALSTLVLTMFCPSSLPPFPPKIHVPRLLHDLCYPWHRSKIELRDPYTKQPSF